MQRESELENRVSEELPKESPKAAGGKKKKIPRNVTINNVFFIT